MRVSFLVCAVILQRIRIPPEPTALRTEGFFHELRAGWTAFTSRTWLWASTVLFGIGNLGFCAWIVLGPVVAKAELGGAGAWGTILAIGGVGAIVGSVISMRIRPRRPLVACTVAAVPLAGQVARARARAVRLAALHRVLLRRSSHRRAPDAVVHAVPAGDPRESAVARQLVRRPGLVRPHADRLRDRRADLRRDRRHGDALALPGRDADDLGGDPLAPVRLGDQGTAVSRPDAPTMPA